MSSAGKIVVTGARGLIGRAVMRSLQRLALPVLAIDQQFCSEGMQGNILDSHWLRACLTRCRGIIHLAAVSRVVWGEMQPELCWQVNVIGTQQILEIANQQPTPPWIIYSSSREVYGQQTTFPVTENVTPQPLNQYARSKLAAEKLLQQYQHQGLRIAILRFSSVYGSASDYSDRVIPAFCLNALKEKSLRIDGLENTFDFTHVEDVVNGILNAIYLLERNPKHLPPIHLTTGVGTALFGVVSLLEEILEKKIHYKEHTQRDYDVHQFVGDPSRAKQVLHWQAKINLKDGLRNLLKQYQKIDISHQIL